MMQTKMVKTRRDTRANLSLRGPPSGKCVKVNQLSDQSVWHLTAKVNSLSYGVGKGPARLCTISVLRSFIQGP